MTKKENVTEISVDDISGFLSYCTEEGGLCWRVSRGSAKKGRRAGCKNADDYVCIGIGGKIYKEHRLVYALHEGEVPDSSIDIVHIDGNRANNKIENLKAIKCNQGGLSYEARLSVSAVESLQSREEYLVAAIAELAKRDPGFKKDLVGELVPELREVFSNAYQ